MQMGLRESMKNEWSGDCDLGDGSLQERMRKESHIISQDLDFHLARLLNEK